jgi:hypothetical protein
MNLNYKKIYDISKNGFRFNYLMIWQERMNAEVQAELKKLFPKRKNPVWDDLPVETKDRMNAEWKLIGDKLNSILNKREKLLKDLLWKVARQGVEIEFTETLQKVYSCDPYKYNSQPNRLGYAHGDAEQKAEYLKKFGVVCEVRKENERTFHDPYSRGRGYTCEFVVYANILDWQFDYFEKQPMDFMGHLVDCWKHGINPQVKYHGLLSQEDFDKSMDIFMGKAKLEKK